MPPSPPLRPTGPAEVVLPCDDLAPTLAFFVDLLGFRVETIFPAEEPSVASLSGHGLRLRLMPEAADGAPRDPGRIRLACNDPGPEADRVLTAPNGTVITLVPTDPPLALPPLVPGFVLTRRRDAPLIPWPPTNVSQNSSISSSRKAVRISISSPVDRL